MSLFQVRQVTQSLYFEIRKSGIKIKVDFTKREDVFNDNMLTLISLSLFIIFN